MLSVALVTGIVSCSQNKSTGEYLEEAHVFLQQNKTAEAIISLKNVLKADANNAEARYLLGKSYINQGNWVIAEKELSRAKRFNYDAALVYPLLAEAYSHLEDGAGIELLLKDVVENKALEQSLRYFLAVSYIYQGEDIQALSELDTVVSLNEDSPYGQLGQAWLYGIRKQFDEATAIADKFVDSEFFSAIALDFNAKTYFSAQKMELAAKNFDAYLKLRALDHQNRLMYAMALAKAQNFEQAEVQADLIMQLSPNNSIANQIKGQAMFANKDFKEAKKFAENAIREPGAHIVAYIVAGVSAYQLNQLEVAHTHLMSVKDKLSYQHPVQKLLTQIRFQLGYADDIFNDIANMPDTELDTQLLAVSAQELFKVGKAEESDKLMQRANQLDPDDAKILYQQGVVKLFREDDSATEFFKSALEKNPDLNVASVSLITTLTRNKKYEEALTEAEEFKKNNPVMGHGLIGGIYLFKGEMAKAKEAFEAVLEIDETHAGGLFNLAKIAQYEGKLPDAVQRYKDILKHNVGHIPAISSLLQLSANDTVKQSIEAYFKENVETNPKMPMAYLSLGEYYLMQKDLSAAKKVAEDGLKVIPGNNYLLMMMAKVETYLKDYDNSLKHLDEVLSKNKNAIESAVIYASKSKILFLQNNIKAAITEQEQAVKVSPNDNAYKYNLANLYLKNGQIKEAKALINSISFLGKENVAFKELKGRVEFLEKNYQQALPWLNKAYTQRPSEQLLLELVTTMQNLAMHKEALAVINQVNNKESSLRIQLKRAELYSDNEPEKAIDIYEEISNQTGGHYVLQNNLAWLYLDKKEYQKALKSAEVAVKAAPNDTMVQDTYAVVLLAAGKVSQSLTIMKKIVESGPANSNYKVHYAQALIANGFKDEASNLLNTISIQDLSSDAQKRFLSAKSEL